MPSAEVVFCGKSLYISSLASGVQMNRDIRVIRLECPLAGISEDIKMLCPNFIVFEQNEASTEEIEGFMDSYSRICLVGVNSENDALTIYYKEDKHTLSKDRWKLFMKLKETFSQ